MKKVIIVFSSITSANGVKSYLLKKYNIQSKIKQTPKSLPISGCSYCLVVGLQDVDIVKKIAKDNNVNIRGIFYEDGTSM